MQAKSQVGKSIQGKRLIQGGAELRQQAGIQTAYEYSTDFCTAHIWYPLIVILRLREKFLPSEKMEMYKLLLSSMFVDCWLVICCGKK